MPDPVLYAEAIFAAAGASAFIVLAFGRLRRPAGATRMSIAIVLAIALSILTGCAVLRIYPNWPPTSGLSRLISIVLPAAMAIEFVAALPRVPRPLVWFLRVALAAASGRVLLHGSVYLDGRDPEWTLRETRVALAICAGMLTAEWWMLTALLRRAAPIPVSLSLAAASMTGGLATMMAGYLRGGEIALPLAAGVTGASVALWAVAREPIFEGAVGISLIGLFGLLFIGRFFGGLSTVAASVVFLAPVLCVVTEIPRLRSRHPSIVGAIRLALVAIPLIVVLVDAKREFDLEMRPLIDAEAGGP